MGILEIKSLLKEWRVWVLLLALATSTFWLGPHYESKNGDLTLDTRLSERTGIQISGGTRLLLDIESNATGSDLREQANQIRNILNVRIAASGLSDARVITMDMGGGDYNIQVESSTNNQTRLKKIVRQQGNFEARMPFYVDGSRNFSIYETYQFSLMNDSRLEVSKFGEEKEVLGVYTENQKFELGPTKAYYHRYSDGSAYLQVVAYDGEDITDVRTSDMRTRQVRGGYSTRFPVVLNKDAAQVSGRVFSNYVPRAGSQLQLENGSRAMMGLYVDGNLRESLTVARELGLERSFSETQSSIQTSGDTAAASRSQSEELQAILKSGSLPAPLTIQSQSVVSASLGSEFMTASLLSILGALLAVGLLVFARYRDPRLVLPIILTGASEVYIMLGFWSWFTPLGSLGLSAIAGIIAAVGTGVDDQIIITDESGRERIRDWSDRMKRAFFVIFTSAASTIGAMTPILAPSLSGVAIGAAGLGLIGYTLYTRGTNYHFVAIGTLAVAVSAFSNSMSPSGGPLSDIHGFAATTILGIIIGITVTRPAYAKFLEHLD